MEFYVAGRSEGDTLTPASSAPCAGCWPIPEFIYRRETEPANVAPGRSYRVNDLALASRLVVLPLEQHS